MGVFGFRELGLLLRPDGGAIDSKLLYFSLRKWIPRSRNSKNRQYNGQNQRNKKRKLWWTKYYTFSLVSNDRCSNPRSTALEASTITITTSMYGRNVRLPQENKDI